jgi:hypothetical protein
VITTSNQDGRQAQNRKRGDEIFIVHIEEISILSNSSHLEWRAGLSDTILKGNHPGTIPARVGLIWFSGFRGEDLNVLKIEKRGDEILIVHCCFSISQNELKF